jgi:sugar lactone lactonase YvrE
MDFEAIAAGFHIEGLCPDGDTLWFTDAFASGVQRRQADGHVDVWLPENRMVASVMLNADGRVLCGGFGGITWLDPADGRSGMLLDAIDGDPIPGVNEMTPDRNGGLYFGVLDMPAVEQHRTPQPGGLYRLSVDGQVSVVNSSVAFPNGIGVSLDGQRLYCNETFSGLTRYDIEPDGTFGPPCLLYEMQDCDGLALDEEGAIWVSGFSSSELLRFAPHGDLLGRTPTPAPGVSNLRFGGAGNRDIFISATWPETIAEFAGGGPLKTKGSRLYRATGGVAGLPIPKTQFRVN